MPRVDMSDDLITSPSSDGSVIFASHVSKCYHLYERPQDRLWQFLWMGRRRLYREFWSLSDVSFELGRGEILGVVGRNGAGKSTLLQLVCGTLAPTSGEISVKGRVAALLELGAGFNPEFTGRENVFLNAAILGVPEDEIRARFDDIVEFSGLRDFIDQPVKTYSSGMYVRLAFSVATSVEPDILVIDEALSVGDGAFARKSFERIMRLKDGGATILFCSHSTYHIDVLCDRALWLDRGRMRMLDSAHKVTAAYNEFLALDDQPRPQSPEVVVPVVAAPAGTARILAVRGECDGVENSHLAVISRKSTLVVTVEFVSDPELPCPCVALGLDSSTGVKVSSAISLEQPDSVLRSADGQGVAKVTFPALPLLKGGYEISVFLACERGMHVYDAAPQCLTLSVSQDDVLQGLVALPHVWGGA